MSWLQVKLGAGGSLVFKKWDPDGLKPGQDGYMNNGDGFLCTHLYMENNFLVTGFKAT